MKGVIVAAGYGTRFLPVTKSVPKEMLPLWDKPLIDFILDEFEEAGIRDVILITSRRKSALENYLDREIELEQVFEKEGKKAFLDAIKPRNMNFLTVRQREMKGTGHAILLAKQALGREEFVVAYPDDIVLSKPGLTRRMADHYSKNGKSILAVRRETENISRYGVIELKKDGDRLVNRIVEKPKAEDAPSDLVSVGRYLFTAEILDLLEEGWKKHRGGEFYHIDAINEMAARGRVAALEVEGTVLDTGETDSYLESLLKYVDRHPRGKAILEKYLKNSGR